MRTLPYLLLLALGPAACASPRAAGPAPPAAAVQPMGDVRFMRDMIVHHAQALELAALVSERTDREDMRRLAARISASQADEIELMQRWLASRGVRAADEHAHHMPGADGGHRMPGMIGADEVARLATLRRADFDRLFLEYMIRHHEGALVMVAELFAAEGSGQDVELFRFASGVDADQRAEIARMRGLLASIPQRGSE